VLQSAALAGISTPGVEVAGGEIFLLDMGAPIRVLEMARRFIRSQGLEPDVDVRIEFTGIRPGEKLFEELAYHSEDMIPTSHAGIRVWSTTPPDRDHMRGILARFDKLRHPPGASHPWQGASRDEILALIRAGVPEMLPTKIGTDDDALKITVVNRVPRLPIA
jgi:FlaA1/EpsC-like NDP-sugar epimerase